MSIARGGLGLAGVAVLAACQGSQVFETVGTGAVIREDLVGTFDATSFTMTIDGATTDLLAAGGSLTLTLSFAGDVSGRLVAPGAGEQGADLDEDMVGSWTFDSITHIVHFTQTTHTFVRLAVFVPSRTGDSETIHLTASYSGDGNADNPAFDVVLEQR